VALHRVRVLEHLGTEEGVPLMPRQYIGKSVLCRYPADVLHGLDALAARDGITRAELLRRIARDELKRQKVKL